MTERSIFFEEWRRCLQEHYRHVIRTGDTVTEKTLVGVLHRVGFTDDDLRQLYLEATINAEHVAPDFVPDMSKIPFVAHPAECTCEICLEKALEAGHDLEGQPVLSEPVPEPEPEAAGNSFAGIHLEEAPEAEAAEPEDEALAQGENDKKDDNRKPKQLTMF